MGKASPFANALRGALESLSSAASDSRLEPTEAVIARKLLRDIEQSLARLEHTGPGETDLISIACHDLKDPLASIVMGAGFLRKTIPAEDAAGKRVVEAIVRSTERMSQVIADFHDLAKLESGRIVLDLRPWDVVALLQAAAPSFEVKAKERGLRFDLEMPSSPLLAVCDRARLTQVVTKLLANAVKFTNAEGRVSLRAEAISGEGSGSSRTTGARITVSDTGRGIAADRVPTIFDYLANARRSPRDGPGLGLPIAQTLLRLHGSAIDVTTKVDEGSSFTFTLPAPAPSAPA